MKRLAAVACALLAAVALTACKDEAQDCVNRGGQWVHTSDVMIMMLVSTKPVVFVPTWRPVHECIGATS